MRDGYSRLLTLKSLFAVAVFFVTGIYGFLSWSKPQVPVFPDISNADGTIDYTLVGAELLGRNLELVGYDKLVIRLPKEIEVRRPEAKGGSGSGAGVSFSYPANPNGAIALKFDLHSLFLTRTRPEDYGVSASLNENDRVSLTLFPRINKGQEDTLQKYFWQNCNPVEQTTIGLVRYVGKPGGKKDCNNYPGYKDFYVLMFLGEPVAFVKCSVEVGNSCNYQFWYLERNVMGDFPISKISEFPKMFSSLSEFLKNSTLVQDRIKLR
jgi:hypothetical protein